MPASFLDPDLSRGFAVFGAASAFVPVLLFFWLSEYGAGAFGGCCAGGSGENARFGRSEVPGEQRMVPAADFVSLFAQRYDLTDRQAEILAALLEGGTSKEIARRLFVTEATVKFHVHNILAKTGFRNRAELAAYSDGGVFGGGLTLTCARLSLAFCLRYTLCGAILPLPR